MATNETFIDLNDPEVIALNPTLPSRVPFIDGSAPDSPVGTGTVTQIGELLLTPAGLYESVSSIISATSPIRVTRLRSQSNLKLTFSLAAAHHLIKANVYPILADIVRGAGADKDVDTETITFAGGGSGSTPSLLTTYTAGGSLGVTAGGILTLANARAVSLYLATAQLPLTRPDTTALQPGDTAWLQTSYPSFPSGYYIYSGTTWALLQRASILRTILAPTAVGTDGQILVYRVAGNGLAWEAAPTGGSGGGSTTLAGLTDTPVGYGTAGQYLRTDGVSASTWATFPSGGGSVTLNDATLADPVASVLQGEGGITIAETDDNKVVVSAGALQTKTHDIQLGSPTFESSSAFSIALVANAELGSSATNPTVLGNISGLTYRNPLAISSRFFRAAIVARSTLPSLGSFYLAQEVGGDPTRRFSGSEFYLVGSVGNNNYFVHAHSSDGFTAISQINSGTVFEPQIDSGNSPATWRGEVLAARVASAINDSSDDDARIAYSRISDPPVIPSSSGGSSITVEQAEKLRGLTFETVLEIETVRFIQAASLPSSLTNANFPSAKSLVAAGGNDIFIGINLLDFTTRGNLFIQLERSGTTTHLDFHTLFVASRRLGSQDIGIAQITGVLDGDEYTVDAQGRALEVLGDISSLEEASESQGARITNLELPSDIKSSPFEVTHYTEAEYSQIPDVVYGDVSRFIDYDPATPEGNEYHDRDVYNFIAGDDNLQIDVGFDWDSTVAYSEIGRLVKDPNTETWYRLRTASPAGTPLTDTSHWTPSPLVWSSTRAYSSPGQIVQNSLGSWYELLQALPDPVGGITLEDDEYWRQIPAAPRLLLGASGTDLNENLLHIISTNTSFGVRSDGNDIFEENASAFHPIFRAGHNPGDADRGRIELGIRAIGGGQGEFRVKVDNGATPPALETETRDRNFVFVGNRQTVERVILWQMPVSRVRGRIGRAVSTLEFNASTTDTSLPSFESGLPAARRTVSLHATVRIPGIADTVHTYDIVLDSAVTTTTNLPPLNITGPGGVPYTFQGDYVLGRARSILGVEDHSLIMEFSVRDSNGLVNLRNTVDLSVSYQYQFTPTVSPFAMGITTQVFPGSFHFSNTQSPLTIVLAQANAHQRTNAGNVGLWLNYGGTINGPISLPISRATLNQWVEDSRRMIIGNIDRYDGASLDRDRAIDFGKIYSLPWSKPSYVPQQPTSAELVHLNSNAALPHLGLFRRDVHGRDIYQLEGELRARGVSPTGTPYLIRPRALESGGYAFGSDDAFVPDYRVLVYQLMELPEAYNLTAFREQDFFANRGPKLDMFGRELLPTKVWVSAPESREVTVTIPFGYNTRITEMYGREGLPPSLGNYHDHTNHFFSYRALAQTGETGGIGKGSERAVRPGDGAYVSAGAAIVGIAGLFDTTNSTLLMRWQPLTLADPVEAKGFIITVEKPST